MVSPNKVKNTHTAAVKTRKAQSPDPKIIHELMYYFGVDLLLA